MDFIEQLPASTGFTAILVIVDRLSKQAIFHDTITSLELAKLFLLHVFSKHGVPAVGGKSLEGAKYSVRPRRLGLAGLGELRGLECRSTLEGSRSRESREGVRSAAKCAGNAQLESLGVA